MRVLHVIPSVAPRDGGPSAAIGPMCRALSARGVEILLASTNADGGAQLAVPVATRFQWQGISAICFERDFSESLKYSYGFGTWISRHVSDFDVVHIHGFLS